LHFHFLLKDPVQFVRAWVNIKPALHRCKAPLQNIFQGVAKKRKLAYHATMETHQAIEKAGSAVALAKLLGITRQAISQWGDRVPQARLWQLRALRPKWFKG
jgi:hypothetical protein